MADISKIDNGTEYNLKDATARAGIESSKTLKSSVVTVTDAAPINAEDITVDITPKQDLHGYDRPWAGGAWKNKLEPHEVGSDSMRGINVTYNADESISLTATAITGSSDNVYLSLYGANTTDVSLLSPLFNGLVAGGAIDLTLEGNPTGVGLMCQFNRADGSLTTPLSTFSSKVTSTVPSDAVYVYVALVIKKYSVTLPMDATVRVQISSTGSLQDWTPYSNICPIEGRTGAELDRVGKNWFGYGKNVEDKTSEYRENYTQRVTTIKNSDNSITISPTGGTWSIGVYIIEGVDGTLPWKLSYDITENTTSYSPVMRIDTGQTNERLRMYAAFNNKSYLSSSEKVTFSNIQLEQGSTATTYEPYQGEQYTASFGQTVHGGKWHVTEGGTDKTHGNIASYNGETINEPWLSSLDEYVAGATPTTGAQVVYPLTTPTTISTPKQNVPMLKGINTVYADCGDVSLKYQPDNVIGELKGEIQVANSFVAKMALREGSGAKDFSYGGWSFRIRIFRSMGQISLYVENISASNVTEQAIVKGFNDESDYRAPEELRPNFNLLQAATYTTPSGWAIQVYLKDDGYIMFTGVAPEVGASAPTSSNWNLVEPWAAHQQAKDLFNN